ncbi:MAG: hypothetical protein IT183_06400 [Acidobacteria bacterium]|nr:hypothetical protein [Acidobacteriota bacterium]
MTVDSFDRRQYVLLLTLLRTLGSRRELTSQFGMHGPALGILAGLGLLMGGFIALLVMSGQIPARDVLMICQGMTAIVLVPLLVSEAADALLNPAEASVLAHRPVGNLTYLAAKVTYLLGFALTVGWSFNLLPALAGVRLDGTAWFYPLTHLTAATIGAAFTALATCGVFGVVFRIVPVSRVRNVALWVQLLGGVAVPLLPHLSRLLNVRPDFDATYWSAVPMAWFAALGLAGQTGGQRLVAAVALPAMVASAVLVAAGFRALSQGYMTRVSTVVRSKRPPSRRVRRRWLSPVLGSIAGSPPAFGTSVFVIRMALGDWQFRRAMLRGAVPMLMLALFAFGRGGLRSPFAGGPGFTIAHMLPHIMGLALVTAADFLPFSDHYKARWIFLTAPASGLRGVVRGTVTTLWVMGALAPSLLIFAITSSWGIGEAALFAGYSLTVLSFYLGTFAWIQTGLPFTRPPDPARAAGNITIMMTCAVVALILGAVQAIWVFPHPGRVVVLSAALAVGAWFAMRMSIRILESRVPETLQGFVQAPGRLFSMTHGDEHA